MTKRTYAYFGICIEEDARIYAENVNEKIKFHYPLTRESTIVVFGGHRGEWIDDMISHLGFAPRIIAFEPIAEFVEAAKARLHGRFRHIEFKNYGVGDKTETQEFFVDGDRTGFFGDAALPKRTVQLLDIKEAWQDANLGEVDLIYCNCEGGEFSLVPRLVETGLISNIKNLAVQFHNVVPNGEERRLAIIESVNRTHDHVYEYPFCWDVWRRKGL